MGVLLHDEELECHRNPLGAEILADAFMAACGDTDASLKARLLFVTMWDKHMQNGVLSLYHEINQYLVEKNILPKIKRELKRQGMSNVAHIAAAAAQAAVEAMGFDDDAGEVFQTMQHLFSAAAARGTLPGMGGMPGMMSGSYAAPGTPGMAWSNAVMGKAGVSVAHNPMVVTQLTQLQHGDATLMGGGALLPLRTRSSCPVPNARPTALDTVLLDEAAADPQAQHAGKVLHERVATQRS